MPGQNVEAVCVHRNNAAIFDPSRSPGDRAPAPCALRSTLKDNNLTGRIPDSITNLVQLKQLDLSSNAVGGQIPSNLAALQRLRHLRWGAAAAMCRSVWPALTPSASLALPAASTTTSSPGPSLRPSPTTRTRGPRCSTYSSSTTSSRAPFPTRSSGPRRSRPLLPTSTSRPCACPSRTHPRTDTLATCSLLPGAATWSTTRCLGPSPTAWSARR